MLNDQRVKLIAEYLKNTKTKKLKVEKMRLPESVDFYFPEGVFQTKKPKVDLMRLPESVDFYFPEDVFQTKKPQVETMRATKITDLNEYCLRDIFKFLNMKEAFIMATLHDKFIAPADVMNRQKAEPITITLLDSESLRDLVPLSISKSIKLDLELHQYIGQEIDKLSIDFNVTGTHNHSYLENLILKNCSELTELELKNCQKGAFEDIGKPFEKVEVFHYTGILGPNFSQFQKWFPKLRRMTLDCYLFDESCVMNLATTFPALEYMSVNLYKRIPPSSQTRTPCKVDEIIKANPQVRSVRLNFGKNFVFDLSKSFSN